MTAIGATDVVVIVVIEEVRIVLQRPVEVEGSLIEHFGKIDFGALRAIDAGRGIDDAYRCLDAFELLGRYEIGLVEQHDVGKGDLVLGFPAVLQAERQVLGVNERDDGVELGLGPDVVIHVQEKRKVRRADER